MTLSVAMTGLKAAAQELSNTANNIANASTIGFKRSTVYFGDNFSSSSNGKQTEQGVRVTAISQHFGQGNVTSTNSDTDLAITGDGFFRMSDNHDIYYTRAGNFGLDKDGYMVNSDGHRLTGYPADKKGIISSIQGELWVDPADAAPLASEEVYINLNLDANSEVLPEYNIEDQTSFNFSSSAVVFDSLGTSHLATMNFHKIEPNTWAIHTYVGDQKISPDGGDTLQFSDSGAVINVNGDQSNSLTHQSFTPAPGAAEMTLTFDLSHITQFDGPSGINEVSQNGHPAGRLNGIEISEDGTIFGRYTNEQLRTLGQVTVTKFRNPQGLAQLGNGGWSETRSSGDAITGIAGGSSLGLIRSGTLEESNVDITDELVRMIGTQRNYQANSQVISVTDTMTQTVMNIRR